MKGGDISNFTAPIIAFNVDNLLWIRKDVGSSNWGKFMNKLFSVINSPEVDFRFVKLLQDLWHNDVSFTIHLYTRKEGADYEKLENFLYEKGVYFTSLKKFPSLEEMRFVVANQCFFYFDIDREFLLSLGTNNARLISEIGNSIGLGYSFPLEGE